MKPLSVVKNCFSYLTEISKKLFQKSQPIPSRNNTEPVSTQVTIKPQNNNKLTVPIKIINLEKESKSKTNIYQMLQKKQMEKPTNTLKNLQKQQKLNALKIGFRDNPIRPKQQKNVNAMPFTSLKACNQPQQLEKIKEKKKNQTINRKDLVYRKDQSFYQGKNKEEEKNLANISKKQRKIQKKERKILLPQVNAEQDEVYFFRYEDGSDISSIAERSQTRSQTGDELQSQLFCFLDKKSKRSYFKQKSNEISINVKKKKGFEQGIVTKKDEGLGQIKEKKTNKVQEYKEIKPQKRPLSIYPGETLQQFKKRILLNYGESSESQSSMMQESYNQVLNRSIVAMQEQNSSQSMDNQAQNLHNNFSQAEKDNDRHQF